MRPSILARRPGGVKAQAPGFHQAMVSGLAKAPRPACLKPEPPLPGREGDYPTSLCLFIKKAGPPAGLDSLRWSGRRELNPRLQPWQGCTLPLSYSRSTSRYTNRQRCCVKAKCALNRDRKLIMPPEPRRPG